MAEESIDDRERELLDYILFNLEDPEERSTLVEEAFAAADGQEEYILNNNNITCVKNTITINGTTYRRGKHYIVEYGNSDEKTAKITFSDPLTTNDAVIIPYYYGTALIEREYSRTKTKLPRIIMKLLLGGEEFAGLGEITEGGQGSYFNMSYKFILRDSRDIRNDQTNASLLNILRRVRHAGLYKHIISAIESWETFGYDIAKECYIRHVSFNVKWEVNFE